MPTVEELSLPVPWGHIAAKAWGSPEKPRVLAIHGLNDNAASFDQLIPLLSSDLYVVCVDLPGHGLSSHLPSGLISLLDYVFALKYLINHLGWDHFSILAHSFGCHIAIYCSALYNQAVSRLMLMDLLIAHIIPEGDFVLERCEMMFDKFLKVKNDKRKTYKYKDSLKNLYNGRQTHLEPQSVRALQKRAFRKSADGYVYNNDRRLVLLLYPMITFSLHSGLVNGVDCCVLVMMSSESAVLLSTPATQRTLADLKQKLGWRMRVEHVQGSHDVHMDCPHTVAPVIRRFLSHRSQL